MDLSNYPLAELMRIKVKRFEQAMKVVEEKAAILKREQKLLKQEEEERDKVLQHKNDKLQQLRDALDRGERTDKIRQIKVYMDVVKEKLVEKERKVEEQKKQVKDAEKQLDLARKEMMKKQKELEKLKIHKKEWQKEMRFWTARKEGLEQDELGSQRHIIRKKQKKNP